MGTILEILITILVLLVAVALFTLVIFPHYQKKSRELPDAKRKWTDPKQ